MTGKGELLETFDRYEDADAHRFEYAKTLVALGQHDRYCIAVRRYARAWGVFVREV